MTPGQAARIRVVPIRFLREALRMTATRRGDKSAVYRRKAPYGYGVFLGFGLDPDFREAWFNTEAEAEAEAERWKSE